MTEERLVEVGGKEERRDGDRDFTVRGDKLVREARQPNPGIGSRAKRPGG
jgi:hypothetical protein